MRRNLQKFFVSFVSLVVFRLSLREEHKVIIDVK